MSLGPSLASGESPLVWLDNQNAFPLQMITSEMECGTMLANEGVLKDFPHSWIGTEERDIPFSASGSYLLTLELQQWSWNHEWSQSKRRGQWPEAEQRKEKINKTWVLKLLALITLQIKRSGYERATFNRGSLTGPESILGDGTSAPF